MDPILKTECKYFEELFFKNISVHGLQDTMKWREAAFKNEKLDSTCMLDLKMEL